MEKIKIDNVKALLHALEEQDFDSAEKALSEINRAKDSNLMTEVKKITQSLQDTLDDFGEDNTLLQHTKYGLPDASERLEYVMKTTEEASEKTLSSAENINAIVETLGVRFDQGELDEVLKSIQAEVTEIMMAQSFQDLTGQVLKRVILLITSVENSMVELVEKSGIELEAIQQNNASKEEEMKGLGPNVTRNSQKDTLKDQADVDDLLNDLGI